MEVFNYIAVAVSLIVGLGLTCLLDDACKLIQRRRQITVYWVHLLWAFIVVMLHFQLWWAFWSFHTVQTWTYALFLFYMFSPTALFVAADLLFPDMSSDDATDLEAYYFGIHRWLFGTLATYLLLATYFASELRVGGQWLQASNAIRIIGLGICIGAMSTKNKMAHGVLAVAFFFFLVVFVTVFNDVPLRVATS